MERGDWIMNDLAVFLLAALIPTAYCAAVSY